MPTGQFTGEIKPNSVIYPIDKLKEINDLFNPILMKLEDGSLAYVSQKIPGLILEYIKEVV